MTFEEFDNLFLSHIPISRENVLFIDGVKAKEMIKDNSEHARRWFNEYIYVLKPITNDKVQQIILSLLVEIACYFELHESNKSYRERLYKIMGIQEG